ncbi:MAG: hydrogenase expression/formation protein HypE [Oscillospiraceae bacterium]
MKINTSHGSGGKATSDLIRSVFAKHFSNKILDCMEDSAVVDSSAKIAITTDSFVITPIFFKGGDIGKLSIVGTVNDLLMRGAVPKYITCGFIIEEGTDFETLDKIAQSMSKTAKEANVLIVAGDTKVIEGNGGVYINTAGVGFVENEIEVASCKCENDDVIILSGTLGDHHATVLSSRLNIENDIQSDCAPLNEMVLGLIQNSIRVKAMRDVTRGGLATILNEIFDASKCGIEIFEDAIPVSSQVRGLCDILGLDPLYMGNEGKFVVVVNAKDAKKALSLLKSSKYGENASIIGKMSSVQNNVVLKTSIGGKRIIEELFGEGLPRIC